MAPRTGARRGALVGVLTIVLSAAAVAPALADDGVSEVQFKLPNRAAVDTLNNMGADLAENVTPGPDGSVYVEAIVTPEQKAEYAALGYQPIQTVADESTWKQATDEADAADRAQADAFRNLRSTARSKSLAATDTVNVGRADYFQNYAGRFISIEAHTSDGGVDANGGYTGPVMTAEWLDGSGASMGSGTLSPFVDDDVYLYHRMLFRVGAVGDGGTMPATVRVASADGGVDTLAVKEWTSTNGKSSPVGFIDDFNDNYTDPQKAYQRIADLAAQYPNIAEVYDLPNKTNGYQRKSQAIVGTATPYNPRLDSQSSAGTVSNTGADPDTGKAVVVTSRLYGQDGGNNESITITDPAGAANQPLSVSVTGNDITVNPATDGAGKITSTSQQVVDAINSNSAASNLVYAEILTSTSTRASGIAVNAGHGIVAPTAKTMLSDFLKAPPSYPRGPQTVKMIRIGAHRDGSKTGVFIYCQEHAREWATPLVCLETVQRLLVNYATDPETKSLVDNLDIFVIPTINADGAAFSRYDFTMQRKNMFNYCAGGNLATGPNGRNSWGVDINRNFSVGSLFDGYEGASTTCTSDVFAGTGEFSEPESRNEQYVQSTYPNIKFAMNVHSSGGYFMWPPGAYKTDGRVLLPYASPGTNQYFEQTARTVLDRIKSYRGTVVLPARTGPVADVLYSAAGNSADEAYYNHGIIGYDFEIGAQRFTPQSGGTAVGPLSDPGFTPPFANEGHDEGMEFANGNYALLDAALDYENDTTPPTVTPVSSTGSDISPSSYSVTFDQSEAADIWYTTDGSTPTESSAHYGPALTRGQPVPIPIVGTTTLRWLAKDFKGNVSTGSKTFYVGGTGTVGGTVPATLSLALGPAADFGPFTPGVSKVYDASTTATVTSTAGDALLTVSDPDAAHPGHLVNGSFFLAQPLQMKATDPNTSGTAFNPIGSSYNLLSWGGPVSSDPVTLWFEQSIGSGEALRTGTYAKALTFTLSTTTP